MKITVNNKEMDTALNNRMIPRADWGDTPLEEGASVVIIKAACGG